MSESNMQKTHSPYTPTTNEVRKRYSRGYLTEHVQEFDRWLAEVKADAWQDGAYYIAGRDNELVAKADADNPYRQGEN